MNTINEVLRKREREGGRERERETLWVSHFCMYPLTQLSYHTTMRYCVGGIVMYVCR